MRTIFTIKIKKRKSPEDSSYDQELVSSVIDTCKVERGVLGNFVVKMLLDNMKDSNYSLSCLTKPGYFYIRNFAPPSMDLIPVSLLALVGNFERWEFTDVFKAKLKTSKSLVHVYSVKVEGEFRR